MTAFSDSGRGEAPPILVPVHSLTRYLRARLEVTGGVLRWEVPRTVLGVLPAGERHVSVPIGDVGSIEVRRVVRPLNLLIGAVLAAVPWLLGWWWAAGPLGVFGLWVILVSLGPRLEVLTVGGEEHHADVCFGHEDVCFGHELDAEIYMAAVDDLANERREQG